MAAQQGNPEVFNLGRQGGLIGSKTLTKPELIKSVVLATDGEALTDLWDCAQYILYHAPNVEVLTVIDTSDRWDDADGLLIALTSERMPELKLKSIQFIGDSPNEYGHVYAASRMDPEEKWQLPARARGYTSYTPLTNVRTLALPPDCVVDRYADTRFSQFLEHFTYKTEVCRDCAEEDCLYPGTDCTDCSYATRLETLIVQMNAMRSTQDRFELIDAALCCGVPNVIFRGSLSPQRRELSAALMGPSTVRYLETEESHRRAGSETYERVAGELFDDKKFPHLLRWSVAQPTHSDTVRLAYKRIDVWDMMNRPEMPLADTHARQLLRRIHVKFAVPMLAMYALAIKMTTVNNGHALCNSLTSVHSGIMQTVYKFAFPVDMGLMPQDDQEPPKWSIRTMSRQQEWRDLSYGIPDIGRINRFVNNSLYIKNELFDKQAAMQIVAALRLSGRKRKPARE